MPPPAPIPDSPASPDGTGKRWFRDDPPPPPPADRDDEWYKVEYEGISQSAWDRRCLPYWDPVRIPRWDPSGYYQEWSMLKQPERAEDEERRRVVQEMKVDPGGYWANREKEREKEMEKGGQREPVERKGWPTPPMSDRERTQTEERLSEELVDVKDERVEAEEGAAQLANQAPGERPHRGSDGASLDPLAHLFGEYRSPLSQSTQSSRGTTPSTINLPTPAACEGSASELGDVKPDFADLSLKAIDRLPTAAPAVDDAPPLDPAAHLESPQAQAGVPKSTAPVAEGSSVPKNPTAIPPTSDSLREANAISTTGPLKRPPSLKSRPSLSSASPVAKTSSLHVNPPAELKQTSTAPSIRFGFRDHPLPGPSASLAQHGGLSALGPPIALADPAKKKAELARKLSGMSFKCRPAPNSSSEAGPSQPRVTPSAIPPTRVAPVTQPTSSVASPATQDDNQPKYKTKTFRNSIGVDADYRSSLGKAAVSSTASPTTTQQRVSSTSSVGGEVEGEERRHSTFGFPKRSISESTVSAPCRPPLATKPPTTLNQGPSASSLSDRRIVSGPSTFSDPVVGRKDSEPLRSLKNASANPSTASLELEMEADSDDEIASLEDLFVDREQSPARPNDPASSSEDDLPLAVKKQRRIRAETPDDSSDDDLPLAVKNRRRVRSETPHGEQQREESESESEFDEDNSDVLPRSPPRIGRKRRRSSRVAEPSHRPSSRRKSDRPTRKKHHKFTRSSLPSTGDLKLQSPKGASRAGKWEAIPGLWISMHEYWDYDAEDEQDIATLKAYILCDLEGWKRSKDVYVRRCRDTPVGKRKWLTLYHRYRSRIQRDIDTEK